MKPADIKVGTLCWCRVQDSKEDRDTDYSTGQRKPRGRTPVIVTNILEGRDPSTGKPSYRYLVARRDSRHKTMTRMRTAGELHAADKVTPA